MARRVGYGERARELANQDCTDFTTRDGFPDPFASARVRSRSEAFREDHRLAGRIVALYQTAVELCLKNFRADHGKFYGPAGGLPLGAGLLIRDCVLALPHSAEIRFQTGIGLALIITHECDIDQKNERNFNDLMLVCPIITLDDFCAELEEEEGAGAWGGILPEIAGNNVYRAMYLPPLPPSFSYPEMDGGGIIYLNHICPCRIAWIESPATQAICSLSALGLRRFDAKLQNHLFREKAVSLWFGR